MKKITLRTLPDFKISSLQEIWKTKNDVKRTIVQKNNEYGFKGGEKYPFYSQDDGIFTETIRVAKNWKDFDKKIRKILILLNLEFFMLNFDESICILADR